VTCGDGTRSAGRVVRRGGAFVVLARHRYRAARVRRAARVVVRDDRGATLTTAVRPRLVR